MPTAAGRVHFYKGDAETGIDGTPNPSGGQIIDSATPTENALIETASVMNAYDVVLFPCKGGEALYDAANGFPNALPNLLGYGTNGGRFFTTHYSYVWLFQNGGYANTATWNVNNASYTQEFTGFIDTSFATGATLSTWLKEAPVNASTTAGQIPVNVVRNDVSAVGAGAQRWMYAATTGQVAPDPKDPAAFPLHYTFNTPVGGTACGRGVFSDFHVEDASSNPSTGKTFPAACNGTTPASMTSQEKLLEFMLLTRPRASARRSARRSPARAFRRARAARAGRRLRRPDGRLRELHPAPDVRRRRRPRSVRRRGRRQLQARERAQQNGLLREHRRRLRRRDPVRDLHAAPDGAVAVACRVNAGRSTGELHAEVVRRAGDPVRPGERRVRQHPHVPDLPDRRVVQHDDRPVRADLPVTTIEAGRVCVWMTDKAGPSGCRRASLRGGRWCPCVPAFFSLLVGS